MTNYCKLFIFKIKRTKKWLQRTTRNRHWSHLLFPYVQVPAGL